MEGGLGALLVVSHAADRVVALSVLRCRGFSWGLWVLGGGLALAHQRSTTPADTIPVAPSRRRPAAPPPRWRRSDAVRQQRQWPAPALAGAAPGGVGVSLRPRTARCPGRRVAQDGALPRMVRADSTGMKRSVRDDLRRVRDTTPQWSQDLISRPDFRRTVVCAVGAVTAASLGSALGNPYGRSVHVKVTAFVCAAAFVILAVLAVRSAAGELSRVITGRAGAAAGAAVRLTILLTGYLLTLLIGLALLAVPVQHLLVGGALTGVLIGIAAQQALGNVFAGLVLLLNRPFTIGDHIRIRSGALGGEFDGTVTGMGLTYVALNTTSGPLQVPNASILAAAVGPWTEAAAEDATAEHAAVASQATTSTSTDLGQGQGQGTGR